VSPSDARGAVLDCTAPRGFSGQLLQRQHIGVLRPAPRPRHAPRNATQQLEVVLVETNVKSGRNARRGLSDGCLGQYLREIGRLPLLDHAAEVELGRRIRAGDRDAVDALVRHNLRFAVNMARRYARPGIAIEDLIDEANLGLIQAAQRFDERCGYRFISYAVFWIRQAILRYLDHQASPVRVPSGVRRELLRLAHAGERLPQTLGREPTVDEISNWTHLDRERVLWLQQLPTCAVSCDRRGEGEDAEFAMDTLADPQAAFATRIDDDLDMSRLQIDLGRLDSRSAEIVRRYYGLDGLPAESLACIGRRLGVTRERVRQLRDQAVEELRRAVAAA
jgi:RNA polymerase primary sigma factor